LFGVKAVCVMIRRWTRTTHSLYILFCKDRHPTPFVNWLRC
jgi:hypothetical protein